MRSRPPVAALVGRALITSACDFIPGGYSCTAGTNDECDVRTLPLAARLQR